MEQNQKNLINYFHKIAYKRWIKGTSFNNRIGNIGMTFEKEINKEPDNTFFPDFQGIEIKCTTRFSNFPIYLFSTSLEGTTFPEINRIVEKYGYYDKVYKNKKVLYEDFNYFTTHIVDEKWIFKLEVNRNDNKLYFCVYDIYNNLMEKESFIYLTTLYDHVITKLTNLAVIKASKKIEKNDIYFRFYEITIYKLISFDKFLELIEKKIINVSIVGRLSKSGIRCGKYRNKNIEFKIKKENIDKLFKKVYYYNYDTNITFTIRE